MRKTFSSDTVISGVKRLVLSVLKSGPHYQILSGRKEKAVEWQSGVGPASISAIFSVETNAGVTPWMPLPLRRVSVLCSGSDCLFCRR